MKQVLAEKSFTRNSLLRNDPSKKDMPLSVFAFRLKRYMFLVDQEDLKVISREDLKEDFTQSDLSMQSIKPNTERASNKPINPG